MTLADWFFYKSILPIVVCIPELPKGIGENSKKQCRTGKMLHFQIRLFLFKDGKWDDFLKSHGNF